MPRVRLAPAFVVIFLGCACAEETFDLLPPTGGAAASGGMTPGGRGGAGQTATGGGGGRGGAGVGPPGTDCPPGVRCEYCDSPGQCRPGTWCDVFRSYCAPYCGAGFDGMPVECYDRYLPVCDRGRSVCVECTSDTHCRPDSCQRGKCVPSPPPECFTNSQCENPDEPFCFDGTCRPCSSNLHCEAGTHCTLGRCEPDGPPMPAPPN